jgi:hypothetical protein
MGMLEYFELSMGTSLRRKTIQRRIFWAYYILRNLYLYGKLKRHNKFIGSIPGELVGFILTMIMLQEMSGKIYDEQISRIKK